MSITSSEQIKLLQKLLETLEEKKLAYDRALSNLNRTKIAVEKQVETAEEDLQKALGNLDQVRTQLETELVKMDPTIFKIRAHVDM